MIGFITGLNGTLAALLLCALLLIDEAGVPLPLAPNEVLLLLAGLLVATGALNPFVVLPLAFLAMTAGMSIGFFWARALGTARLCDLAARVHAVKTYERASGRLRSAGPVAIGLTRLLPGVRTYATLVAGAAGVGTRRFMTGALPALATWMLVLVATGALIGLPAERVVSSVDGYVVSGVLLLLFGGLAVLALRRAPRREMRAEALSGTPVTVRALLAVVVDLGCVATLVAGLERLAARVVHPGHPLGRVNDAIVVTLLVLTGYVLASRHGAGATLGEGVFAADYRAVLRRRRGRPEDPVESASRSAHVDPRPG